MSTPTPPKLGPYEDFADAASRYHSRSIIAITFQSGDVTRRWSEADLTVHGVGHFEGRILDAGTLDRALMYGRVAPGDVTITLANHDGALTDLFHRFTEPANNVRRGKFEVLEGFTGLPFNQWSKRATLFYSEMEGLDDDRTIRLTLQEDLESRFGEIVPPFESDVLDALIDEHAAFSPIFEIADVVEESPRRVPVVAGHFVARMTANTSSLVHKARGKPEDGIRSRFIARIHDSARATTLDNRFAIVGVSRTAWRTGGDIQVSLIWDGDNGRQYVTAPNLALSEYTINGAGGPWKVLVVHLQWYYELSAGDRVFPDARWEREHATWSSELSDGRDCWIGVATFEGADADGEDADPEARLIARALIGASEHGEWAASHVNIPSFTRVAQDSITFRFRDAIYEPVDAIQRLARILETADIALHVDRTGKLSAAFLPVKDRDSDAEPVLTVTEEHESLPGAVAELAEDSTRHGLKNLVRVDVTGQFPLLEAGAARFLGVRFREDIPEIFSGARQVERRNQASIDRHERESQEEYDGRWHATLDASLALAMRRLGLQADGRYVYRIPVALPGKIPELGSVVAVKHGIVPFGNERLCVVDRIAEDLGGRSLTLTVVDYDDILRARIYLLNDDENYITRQGTENLIIDLTADSPTVTAIDPTFNPTAAVQAGDILVVNTAANQFMCRIAARVSATEITLTTEGGGLLPQATETNVEDWHIERGYVNRASAGGDYSVQSARFGALADDDGKMTNDDDGFLADAS